MYGRKVSLMSVLQTMIIFHGRNGGREWLSQKSFFFRSDAGVGYIFILTIGLLLSFLPPSFRFPMLVLKTGIDGQVEKKLYRLILSLSFPLKRFETTAS